jgi:hypothetical protein
MAEKKLLRIIGVITERRRTRLSALLLDRKKSEEA